MISSARDIRLFALSSCLAPPHPVPAMASMALELERMGKKERKSEARRICVFHAQSTRS